MMIIDIHTHVLPGLDDGAKDWDNCLQMLLESAKCGVQKIIATPHYSPWGKRTTPEIIHQLCKKAETKLKAQYGIEMEIYPGHEIYYRVGIVEDVKSGKALSLAGSRYVLLEFDPIASYQVIYHAIREFVDGGYVPILAHVERYRCLRKEEALRNLKDGGALLQINASVLQGGVFNAESRWTKKHLCEENIDFLSSDMHNTRTRGPLSSEKLEWVRNKIQLEYQKKILCGNGQKIIADMR